MKLQDDQLSLLRPATWSDVWETWRANEENLPHWSAYWSSQGYLSWAAWRQEKVDHFHLAELSWSRFVVPMPEVSVPRFRGGPFKGWVDRFYKGRELPTFAEMAEDGNGIVTHAGVLDLLINFPQSTVMTGIIYRGDVVIMEGMHRSAAIALASRKLTRVARSVRIYLAPWPEERGPLPAPK